MNRGPDERACWSCRMLWFRNTWSWGRRTASEPVLRRGDSAIAADARHAWEISCDAGRRSRTLFTENETNVERIFGVCKTEANTCKDAFHDYVINGKKDA